jgi:AbrB family looped-hinge helix DNA binding protein
VLDIRGKEHHALLVKSTISGKGQITVPARVRDKLGLLPGTPVLFELREGGVLLRKGAGATHPVDRVFGRLVLPRPVDTLLDEMRGPRPAKARRRRRSPRP